MKSCEKRDLSDSVARDFCGKEKWVLSDWEGSDSRKSGAMQLNLPTPPWFPIPDGSDSPSPPPAFPRILTLRSYPPHILFVFASIVRTIFLLNLEQIFFHQGRHLQSLLVITSNSTFPPPWLLQNVYSGNHYSAGLDLFTPEKFNFIPLLSSLPGLAGCKQRLTIILFYSSELSSIILFHYHQLMLLNLLMLLLMLMVLR